MDLSDTQRDVNVWARIWKLRVPPKVCSFLWRAVSGCLPTRFQLHLKGVHVDSDCPSCGSTWETTAHCLVSCHFAHAVWNRVGFSIPIFSGESFGGWLFRTFERLSEDWRAKVAMTLWALWTTRNALVWKHKVARVSYVLFLSTSVLDSWLRVQGAQDHSLAECLDSKDGASV